MRSHLVEVEELDHAFRTGGEVVTACGIVVTPIAGPTEWPRCEVCPGSTDYGNRKEGLTDRPGGRIVWFYVAP